jgi:hypothetical protein
MLYVDESFDGREHYRSMGTIGAGEPASELRIDALQKCFVGVSFK